MLRKDKIGINGNGCEAISRCLASGLGSSEAEEKLEQVVRGRCLKV